MTSFLLTLIFSLPANAGKITYHKGKTDFVAEHDGKTLSYSSPSLKHVFIIDECNRAMLDKFWKRLSERAAQYPHATSLPDEKRGFVQIDNEYRYVMPLGRNHLFRTEQEMILLRAQEKKKCKR